MSMRRQRVLLIWLVACAKMVFDRRPASSEVTCPLDPFQETEDRVTVRAR